MRRFVGLVPFVQLKKREKHPWKRDTLNSTPPWVFFAFFKIAQTVSNVAYHHL